MKHRILALLLSAVMLLSLASCTGGNGGNDTTHADETTSPAPDTSETLTQTTSEPETTLPETEINTPTEVKTLKILAIGNSFSTDCMQYLYNIAKNGGVEEIVLGNLYYGGCSLAQHLSFAKTDSASYKYYKNTDGTWKTTTDYKMSDALADEEWDIISFQQTSKTCGLANSYGTTLTKLVDHVESKVPNAKLIWNMTWAYQQDSTHSSFPNYDNSQQKMYDMIIDCTRECIMTESRFKLIIPCMTSIQNARTSFLGDTLTRDGYHLDYNIGRYIGGLTWYAAITGGDVDKITYNPAPDQISDDMLAVAREAVKNAIAEPLKVTQSAITEGKRPTVETTVVDPTVELSPADFFEEDKALAAASSIDLAKYTLLEWDYLENTYWNCTSTAGTKTPTSGSTVKQNVCSKEKYSLDQLPVGTLFIADSGWQYRIDIYTEADKKYSGTRPGMITDRLFVLSESFMGDAKYLAWNVSSNPKSDISSIYAQAACHVRVYIPVASAG